MPVGTRVGARGMRADWLDLEAVALRVGRDFFLYYRMRIAERQFQSIVR